MLTPDTFARVAKCLAENLEPPALGTALAALAPLLSPKPEEPRQQAKSSVINGNAVADAPHRRTIRRRKPHQSARRQANSPTEVKTKKRPTAADQGHSRGREFHANAPLTAETKPAKPTTTPAPDRSTPTANTKRAIALLQTALRNGPRPLADIEATAANLHIPGQDLDAAKKVLGVVAGRADNGGARAVTIALPT